MKLTYLAPNPARGLCGGLFLLVMAIGAGILWGIGGILFSLGLILAIDVSLDEATERFTGRTRYEPKEPADARS